MIDRILSQVALLRRDRGWSQRELATRSGASRAEVSAIETGRLSPSTVTALKLARALERKVEDLFSIPGPTADAEWALPPRADRGRFWEARVGERKLIYPVELTAAGVVPQDGTFEGESMAREDWSDPERTLVVAGCDPAVGLLASELRRVSGFRVLALTRGSRDALELLSRGLVHAAGVHWSS
ncbi:MAG: helix-turn-helix domain-containing protein, partial [Vicinamibacteria bacterium]